MRFYSTSHQLVVDTPAKLNLSLQIVARRDDGFHELRTTMVSIGLYDTLTFAAEPGDQVQLTVRSIVNSRDEIPCDERNLVVRAARLLQHVSGTTKGARIDLMKRIPSQAGMGGGSSDAAAALVGLNRFWRLGLPPEKLHSLAAQLGSDVNFFLDSPQAAICTGRGEQIEPVALTQQLHFVVVKPPTGLSTRLVFEQFHRMSSAGRRSEGRSDPVFSSGLASLCNGTTNDLEDPARELNFDIARCLDAIEREDVVGAAMTGSGSACYAVCRTLRQALRISNKLRQRKVGAVWTATSGV